MVEPLVVDVYGERTLGEFCVDCDGQAVRFVCEPSLKKGLRFDCGLFLDRACGVKTYLRYPRGRRIALLVETPLETSFFVEQNLHNRFRSVYACWDEIVKGADNTHFFYYGTTWLPESIEQACEQKQKLCSFVGSLEHPQLAGYIMRHHVYEQVKGDARVDCFGKGIRFIDSKAEALVPYRFSVCMENVQANYYFTEKLLDCFLTKTVPLYWGGDDIGSIFDKRGMLCFNTQEELAQLLDSLSAERYESMRPYVEHNWNIARKKGFDTIEGIYKRMAKLLVEQERIGQAGVLTRARARTYALVKGAAHAFK